MEDQTPGRQLTLILRLLCGGYLLYLAYGLRDALTQSPVYLAGAAAFAVIGVLLIWHAVRKLARGEYAGAPTSAEHDTEADCEDDTDE